MITPDRHTLMNRLKETIDSLAYPYTHTELIDATDRKGRPYKYRHITKHAPLVVQLARAVETSSGEAGEALSGFRGIFTSEPAARLEALDRHQAVAAGVRAWVRRLRIRPRRTLVENMRGLVGVASRLDGDALADLVADARSWWCWARTVTGWDSMPWKPHGPCPVCERIGTLRVREAARTALCVECGAWWDSSTIETLGRFVRMWSQSRNPPPDSVDDPGLAA